MWGFLKSSGVPGAVVVLPDPFLCLPQLTFADDGWGAIETSGCRAIRGKVLAQGNDASLV